MNGRINELIRQGNLKTDIIINAFSEIDRVDFVPKDLKRDAYANIALPIGYGQTISQPMIVAIMLEFLDPQQGQKVLDIGSGSGWTTALLCYIVGNHGKVIALEKIEKLSNWGKENVSKYGYVKDFIAEFYVADGTKGFSKNAPYDRILVSASTDKVPNELKAQLVIGGKMVIPIKSSLVYIERISKEEFKQEEFPGFLFVPLVRDD